MPKVSVIIPTYNREKYIVETLESVFAQTFTDYEVIVIDDGSTDNTADVLRPYLDRIIYIRKPNGGPASARNDGIRKAKGVYIAFLDSDDLWVPEKLQMQIDYMDRHPDVGLVFSDYSIFSEDDNGNRKYIQRKDLSSLELSFRRLFNGNFIPNLTVMIRKVCIDSTGYFDESKELIGVEDYEMWLRIARRYKLGHVPSVLSLYRNHNGNLIGTNLEKMYYLHLNVIHNILMLHPTIVNELGVSMEDYYRDYYYRSGRNLYQDKQYRSAIEFLKRSLGYKKLSPKALILFGLSRLRVFWSDREAAGREL